jgi:uncharacterized membrane protein YhhN
MKTALYLIPVLIVTVTILIRAEILKHSKQIYIFKPISTVIVIAMAVLSLFEISQNITYTAGVLAGLTLSLGGDIALMFHENRKAFTIGLALFLLAHIAYTVVFILLGRSSSFDIPVTAALLAAGAGFYFLIKPNLGKMQIPVLAYIAVISLMVSRATSTLASPVFAENQARMIILGAILFYVSDIILAANRFWKPWKYQRISLAFYYCGQMLIALSPNYFA